MTTKFIILTLGAIFFCSSLLSQPYLDYFGKIDSNFKIQKFIEDVEKYMGTDQSFIAKDSNFIHNDLKEIGANFKTKIFSKLESAFAYRFNNIDTSGNKISFQFFELKFIRKKDCQKAMIFFDGHKKHSWGEFKIYSNAVVKNDMMFLVITSQVRNNNFLEFINNLLKKY
ncbi:MAG: hypothetical protein K2W79_12385 [Hydrotalea flava]|nr:hypothetical protein [Hydrotalea flava]